MDTSVFRPRFTVLLALMTVLAVAAGSATQEATTLLLTHAVLVDGTGRSAIPDAWVHVEGAQIMAVGRGQPPTLKGARVLDLTGRTVVPGLSDMHVHLGRVEQARWMLALLLAHGVTTVKEAGNTLRNDVDIRSWLKTAPVMPHVVMSGVTLNGDRAAQRFLQPSPAVLRQLQDNRDFGAEFIKLHNFVSSAALKQIVAFGRTHDIPVDLIVTPRAAIEVERAFERPKGLLWDHLQPPQIHEIPVLERMGYA